MGSIKNSISLILFLTFFTAYILKLVVLYKRDKISANVLAKGQKRKDIKFTELFVKVTTLMWGSAWLILSVAENSIIHLTGKLTDASYVSLIGMIFTAIGLLIFIQAMISMQTSWRVGIDKSTKTKLVTHGIYKFSRNPAFVGFDLMFIGLFFLYPSLLTLGICMLNILAIHLLILQEEKHLRLMFGEEYIEYCHKTPRYILI